MNRSRGGYTFIEILIAMTILIIGIVAIMRMLPIALHEAHSAGEQTMAAAHADAMLGRIRAAGAERLVEQEFVDPGRFSFGGPENRLGKSFNLYQAYRTSFQRMEGAGVVDLQRVVFSVEMPDGRRESFVTYVARQ